MIEITLRADGRITAAGLVPGQVVYLEKEGEWTLKIVRIGKSCKVQEVKHANRKMD